MSLPSTKREVVVTKLGNKFREVTEIQSKELSPPGEGEVIVKAKYVGVNASDIIYTSGGYSPDHIPPFIAGLECLGEVVAVGPKVDMKVGQCVVGLKHGCFSDYVTLPASAAIPVPSLDPALMSIVLSGLTASIALEEEADLKPGKTVMVTAAAGGTGQFVVQLAKMAGCTVVGTCSNPEKSEFLKSIGCSRVIDYTKEDVGEVLSKEFPNGIDVVYECIGKKMFDDCLKNLAVRGRLIVIGAISTYERSSLTDTSEMVSKLPVAQTCLRKSASVRGFFLIHYRDRYPAHIGKLMTLYKSGQLKVATDNGEKVASGPFKSLEMCADAVEFMYSKKNIGKIIVEV